MIVRKKKSGTAGGNRLMALFSGWVPDGKTVDSLKKIAGRLDGEKIEGMVKKLARKQDVSPTLRSYVKTYQGEKKRRLDFLRKLKPASIHAKQHEAVMNAVARGGDPLTERQIGDILQTPESFAEYLCSLSVSQLESFKEALQNNMVKLPENGKKALLKLFTLVQEERYAYEQDWTKNVAPLAAGINTALMLQEKIDQLEKIQRSLPR